jgi:hypothetical protein
MKLIPLSKGMCAKVDDEDYENLAGHRWHAVKMGKVWYACRFVGSYHVSMHRVVLGLARGDGKFVDHRNHDGLDNRRNNLRLCSKSQNAANAERRGHYRGVSRADKRWRAYITVSGRTVVIGRFDTPEEAALAYNREATNAFGEFAVLNQIT